MASQTKISTRRAARAKAPAKAAARIATKPARKPAAVANPLLARWKKGPFDAPPFAAIRAEHFAPAFREA